MLSYLYWIIMFLVEFILQIIKILVEYISFLVSEQLFMAPL